MSQKIRKIAKMKAKRVITGLKSKRPKPPSKKIMRLATRVRVECSKKTPEEKKLLLEFALRRICGKKY